MEVFGIDKPTGRQAPIELEGDDTVRAVKRRMLEAFGYRDDEDLELTHDGVAVEAADDAAISSIEGLEHGAKIEATPTGTSYARMLEQSAVKFADLPEWARRKKVCVLASIERRSRTPICAELRNDKDVMMAYVAACGDFRMAGDAIRADPDVAAKAVSKKGCSLDVLPATVRRNRKVLASASKRRRLESGMFSTSDIAESPDTAAAALRAGLAFSKIPAKVRKSPEVMIAALQCEKIKTLPESFSEHRDLVIAAVSECKRLYASLPESLQSDMGVALATNKNDIGEFPLSLRKNKEFLKRLMEKEKSRCHGFRHICKALRDDAELMKSALQYGCGVNIASDRLKNDRDFAKCAVEVSGQSILGLSPELSEDKELAQLAVRQDCMVLPKLCKELRQDVDVVEAALLQFEQSVSGRGGRRCYVPFRLRKKRAELRKELYAAIKPLRSNAEAMKRLITAGVESSVASTTLFANRDFVLSLNGTSHYSEITAKLKSNKSFVRAMMERDPFFYTHASAEVRNDNDIVKLMLQSDERPDNYHYVLNAIPKKALADPEVALAVVRRGGRAYAIPDEARTKEVVIEALQRDASDSFVPNSLYDCKEVVMLMDLDEARYKKIAKDLKTDRDIQLRAAKCGGLLYRNLPAEQQTDEAFITACIEADPRVILSAPQEVLNNKTYLKLAISKENGIFGWLPEPLRNDLELARLAVHANRKNFAFAGEAAHSDEELVLHAAAAAEMFFYAHPTLRSDPRVAHLAVAAHRGNKSYALCDIDMSKVTSPQRVRRRRYHSEDDDDDEEEY